MDVVSPSQQDIKPSLSVDISENDKCHSKAVAPAVIESENPPEKRQRLDVDQSADIVKSNGTPHLSIKPNGTMLSPEKPSFDNNNSLKEKKKKKHKVDGNSSSKGQTNFINHISQDHLIRKTQKPDSSVPLAPKKRLSDLMYIEQYENGGGYILHAYQDELVRLERNELDALVTRYYKILFAERRKKNIPNPFSNYCIGIVHASAEKVPELLSYMARHYGHMTVKTNAMEMKNDVQSLTMREYVDNVHATYSSGLFRYGPMHSVSLVGVKGEETGTHCSDVIRILEKNAFLRAVMPWGPLSKLEGLDPTKSNDGPILWTRPGEQSVPTKTTPVKRRANRTPLTGSGMIGNLPVFGRGGVPRSTPVLDRTPCHADHADDGLLRHTTAAVGILKAVHSNGNRAPNSGRRIVKDAVLFDPRHYSQLINRLQLDILEPPASQCGNFWADDAELNQLRIEGYRYVRVLLRDDDIYFIPRNVVHQFKSVAAITSVAWHIRLKAYYPTEPSKEPTVLGAFAETKLEEDVVKSARKSKKIGLASKESSMEVDNCASNTESTAQLCVEKNDLPVPVKCPPAEKPTDVVSSMSKLDDQQTTAKEKDTSIMPISIKDSSSDQLTALVPPSDITSSLPSVISQ